MSKLPPIVMTRLDIQRLDAVLHVSDAPAEALDSLESEMSRARVVEPTRVPAQVVTMNSRVRFRDDITGREMSLRLVYPEDAGQPGTLSVLAPAGTALLGMQAGKSIDWKTASGKPIRLTVIEVLYQPEAHQEFHL